MDNSNDKQSTAGLVVLSRTQSAEELAKLVLIPPDRSWNKGTRRGRGQSNLHRYSGIECGSHLHRSASPEAHLEDVLNRLVSANDLLRAFAERAHLEDPETVPLRIWLVVDTTRGEIGFDFSAELLAAISSLGAYFSLEIEFGRDGSDSPAENT
jgi:Domain of unknown function (DUF4279)